MQSKDKELEKMLIADAPACLRCEYMVDPLGLDVRTPRLSWELRDPSLGAKQTGFQIVVSGSKSWDSGKVDSGQSVHVLYGGSELESRDRVTWKVRAWDANGKPSPWSKEARIEMGLLARSDWTGKWVGGDLVGAKSTTVPAPYLRKGFTLKGKVASARLYITALGLYEAYVNGKRVGDDVFTPGWTEYSKRVQYKAYDVTKLLKSGKNAVGAILGDGWYCGCVQSIGRQNWGDRPRLLAQLEVTMADGTKQVVATDESWKYAYGPILESDLLMGETYDARREMTGWAEGAFDDALWRNALLFADPGVRLVGMCGPTVRRIQELKPIAEPRPASPGGNRWIFDLGQNMVGRIRLKVKGAAGTELTVRHAEMLNPDGTLYLTNLRSAKATDCYVLKGGGEEVYEPRFTFHGFRYVEIEGLKEKPTRAMVTGVVLHSDTPPTGSFECSDKLLNQLQHNIQWGQKGNFLEVPTDCPQRDERLGWTGDAQVFCRTASFNMQVAGFFTKWLNDMEDSQSAAGEIPSFVPSAPYGGDGGPAWADAVVICPWTIYQCYGDKAILARHFAMYKRFLDACGASSLDYIREHPEKRPWGGYGDWLALDGSGKTDGGTPKDLIGTAFYAHCSRLVSRMAHALGDESEAARYEELFQKVKAAFQKRFVTGDGLVVGGTQTGYVLALHFDLAPTELRARMLNELVRSIEKNGNKLSTGFVGASYLPYVLSDNGRFDVAFTLLNQKQWPSWLYAVTQGATTIWERWDGWTQERGFQDPGMNSFNHYAYGAIGEWLYSRVAGLDLDPEEPGYKHIVVRPTPGGGLTRASAKLHTMYGAAESAWTLKDGVFELKVTAPPNAWATVTLPGTAESVPEGAKRVSGPAFEVGAGQYVFRCRVAE